MTVNVQRHRNIAVTEPRLNILRVTTALAERVHRRMSQVVEADGLAVTSFQHSPEVVRHKVGVDGGAVRPNTDIPAIGVVRPKEPLVSSWLCWTFPK